MEEKTCTQCKQNVDILPEIAGQFRDLDDDFELHGSIGEPLCSMCLGTGKYIDTPEFSALQKRVSEIRSNTAGIQMKARENIGWVLQVEANNNLLKEIARMALGIIKNPEQGCFATKLLQK